MKAFMTASTSRDFGESQSRQTAMSSSLHGAEEPIREAVWFFLNCAWPADDYAHTCSDWIAAVIGNPAWKAEVRAKLLAEKEESEST